MRSQNTILDLKMNIGQSTLNLKLFLLKRSKNQAHYRGVAGGLLGTVLLLGGSQVLGLGTVN